MEEALELEPCLSQRQSINVSTTADALYLANAVRCEGTGWFVVEWFGRVAVGSTIAVSNGTRLEITSATSDAVIDGGGAELLFNVTHATLSLTNLKLQNGNGVEGGAIAGRFATVYCTNCSFTGNEATEGGGALAVTGSDVAFLGDTYFGQNVAVDGQGGALRLQDSSTLFEGGNVIFEANRASEGGAISGKMAGEVNFTGSSYFYDNMATTSGGAAFLHHVAIRFMEGGAGTTATFVNNSAGVEFGGALAVVGEIDEALKLQVPSVFTNNSATTGGALYLSGRGQRSFVGDARFVANKAIIDGGAVVANRVGRTNDEAWFDNCTFEGNAAVESGGAIVVSTGFVVLNNSVFISNQAGDSGGAVLSDGGYTKSGLVFSDCELLYNRAGSGPALAQVGGSDITEGRVQFRGMTFTANELLCGSKDFLEEHTNGSIASRHLTYMTVCDSCPDWSECDKCVVTDPETVALCSEVLKHTTSLDGYTTIASLSLDEGYWRTSNESRDILRCYNPDACEGGVAEIHGDGNFADGYCADGYQGPYCSVCADDYTRGQGYTCVKCEGSVSRMTQSLGVVLLVILAGIVLRGWVYLTSVPRPSSNRETSRWQRWMAGINKTIPFQAIKVAIVAWQIVTEFASVANVSFPVLYEAFLSMVQVFNLDLAWVASLGCYFNPTFYDRLLAITLTPLSLVGMLVVTFWFARRRYRHDKRSMTEVRRRHLSILILITFLIYSSASSAIFQTFACDPLDTKRTYLRADYRLECHARNNTNAVHRAYMVYAAIMIVVYPIGIPVLYALLLWWAWRRTPHQQQHRRLDSMSDFGAYIELHHRRRLSNDLRNRNSSSRVQGRTPSWIQTPSENDAGNFREDDVPAALRGQSQRQNSAVREYQSTMRDLWQPYKQDRRFYEVLECSRRVMLTGVVVFIYPGTAAQISTTFLLALVFYAMSEALDPYEDERDCWMSRFGHLVVLLSMFVALLQKVDMSDEHGPGQAIYGVVLVAANVLMLAAIAGESLYSVFSHIEDDSSVYCNGLVRCWRRWRSTVKDDAAEGFESFDEQN